MKRTAYFRAKEGVKNGALPVATQSRRGLLSSCGALALAIFGGTFAAGPVHAKGYNGGIFQTFGYGSQGASPYCNVTAYKSSGQQNYSYGGNGESQDNWGGSGRDSINYYGQATLCGFSDAATQNNRILTWANDEDSNVVNMSVGGKLYANGGAVLNNAEIHNLTVSGNFTMPYLSVSSSDVSGTASGADAVALGMGSTNAAGQGSVAVGRSALAGGDDSLAVGSSTRAAGQGAIAIGKAAEAGELASIALGAGAQATQAHDVAIGSSATTSPTVAVAGASIGGTPYSFAGANPIGAFSIGAVGAERQIQNVAAGRLTSTSTDAVNGSQLYATNQQVAANSGAITTIETTLKTISGGGFSGGGQDAGGGASDGGQDAGGGTSGGQDAGGGTSGGGQDAGGGTSGSGQDAGGGTSGGGQDAGSGTSGGGQDAGGGASDGGQDAGGGTSGGGQDAGGGTSGGGQNASGGTTGGGQASSGTSAADTPARPADSGGTSGSGASADQMVHVGDNGTSTAAGANATASNTNATAAGSGAKASGINSTAVGAGASATGAGAVAVGAAADATASNSVAIGQGSVADRENTVSVGSATNARQITNVAAGTHETDAVNVGQMAQGLGQVQDWARSYTDARVRQVDQRASRGVAAAMAMAGLPQAYQPDQNVVGVGMGAFHGQAAIAVGLSSVTPSGRYLFKASLSHNVGGNTGVSLGAGMVW